MSFAEFPLEQAVAERARRAGFSLDFATVAGIAGHARAVIAANESLHLTAILDPADFVERHIGESLEGAAQLEPTVTGTLVDLGSGNGYPAIPLALARPGLRPRLVESSAKKAAFLRNVAVSLGWPPSVVVERAVRSARDLTDCDPVDVLTTRAMGDWERIVPKLAAAIAPRGVILLWAGGDAKAILDRAAWRRFALGRRIPLPGRDRSWIWRLTLKPPPDHR